MRQTVRVVASLLQSLTPLSALGARCAPERSRIVCSEMAVPVRTCALPPPPQTLPSALAVQSPGLIYRE